MPRMSDEDIRALSDRLWFEHGQAYSEEFLREIMLWPRRKRKQSLLRRVFAALRPRGR
jgi:hypothetical protein